MAQDWPRIGPGLAQDWPRIDLKAASVTYLEKWWRTGLLSLCLNCVDLAVETRALRIAAKRVLKKTVAGARIGYRVHGGPQGPPASDNCSSGGVSRAARVDMAARGLSGFSY